MSNIWLHGFEAPAAMGSILRRLLLSKALIHSMIFSFFGVSIDCPSIEEGPVHVFRHWTFGQ